ncbi:hypothetical protein Ocin01_07612 [Orchesella cincta]|uniref:Uncharacterized protein n=1 Tax=Orchesella cincta TaxID=48709 RepID=A0A1D2N1C1_ORCCI|nr:hypothetical protein Ocin01_07612 [Orchesella cincta]
MDRYNLRSVRKKELEIESDYRSINSNFYICAQIRFSQCNINIKFIDEYIAIDLKARLGVNGLLTCNDSSLFDGSTGHILYEVEKKYGAVLKELQEFRMRFAKEKEILAKATREATGFVTHSELDMMTTNERKVLVQKWNDEVKAISDWLPQICQLSLDWENAKPRLNKEMNFLEEILISVGINKQPVNPA